jgi:excisionase family DNA binding protein
VGVKEIADLLGLPKSWIYDRVRTERIPFYKIGKYVKFDPQEVKVWLKSQRKGPHLDIPVRESKLPLSTMDRKEGYYG